MKATDLELRHAGIEPRNVYPLLGRRVWIPAWRPLDDDKGSGIPSPELVFQVEQLGGVVVSDIECADLIVIPVEARPRWTAAVRTEASRIGIGVLFESALHELYKANNMQRLELCLTEDGATMAEIVA
jgi:hypothetical protein